MLLFVPLLRSLRVRSVLLGLLLIFAAYLPFRDAGAHLLTGTREYARRWVAKMKELDMTHEYIEIKDGNHVSSITQNPEMIGKVFTFFNAQKRKGAPQPAGAVAGEGR